jgi:hypothetical protein
MMNENTMPTKPTTRQLYARALATIPPNQAPAIAWRMAVGMSVVALAAAVLTVELFAGRVARFVGIKRGA